MPKPTVEKRHCPECSGELTQRPHESMKRFMAKKFDTAACSRIYMKREKLGWWATEVQGWNNGAFSKKGNAKSIE